MSREWHETEILKRLEPNFVRKNLWMLDIQCANTGTKMISDGSVKSLIWKASPRLTTILSEDYV